VVFINQIRMQIGVTFGNPETTAGGRALKFYASVRMDIRRIGSLKDGDRVVGNRTKVKVVKNKVAAPFRDAEFDIVYNEGISREGELLDVGVDRDLVQKLGTWMSFGDERLGQGRENARLYLKEHPDVRAKLEGKVREALGLAPARPAVAVPAVVVTVREPAVAGAGAGAGRNAPAVRPKR
jgi:recombination protein RecA